MIKVGIAGADSPDGGELIRLLAMHPDVELMSAGAPGHEGESVSAVHHGLIGETDLKFSAATDYSKCDVLFICTPTLSEDEYIRIRESRPEMKIIFLEGQEWVKSNEEVVYGLPEINRKQLVRGAKAAIVPESFASMALVSLFPFAKNLLVNSEVSMEVNAPAKIISISNLEKIATEIERELGNVQTSFDKEIKINANESTSRRSAQMDIKFDCGLSLAQCMSLYDIYDDHHFTYVTEMTVGVSEVAGTNKCVISICKPTEEEVQLSVVADCRLRGAAGEAVHIMNLMFQLHERTGLALKAIDFEK